MNTLNGKKYTNDELFQLLTALGYTGTITDMLARYHADQEAKQ